MNYTDAAFREIHLEDMLDFGWTECGLLSVFEEVTVSGNVAEGRPGAVDCDDCLAEADGYPWSLIDPLAA